jgi:hypothetical protein
LRILGSYFLLKNTWFRFYTYLNSLHYIYTDYQAEISLVRNSIWQAPTLPTQPQWPTLQVLRNFWNKTKNKKIRVAELVPMLFILWSTKGSAVGILAWPIYFFPCVVRLALCDETEQRKLIIWLSYLLGRPKVNFTA